MKDLVEIKDGQLFTTSHKIAKQFGKRHDHVLRDIDKLVSEEPEFCLPNFGEMNEISNLATNGDRSYKITEAGYSYLVLGFTGAKARRFKIEYIKEFHLMRSTIEKAIGEKLIVAETTTAWAMGELEAMTTRQPHHKESMAGRMGISKAASGECLQAMCDGTELGFNDRLVRVRDYFVLPTAKHVTGQKGRTILFAESIIEVIKARVAKYRQTDIEDICPLM